MRVPDKDWKLRSIKLTGDRVFPFLVEGENLNYPPDHMDRHFRWRVPGGEWDRYDFSEAEIGINARDRLEALGVL